MFRKSSRNLVKNVLSVTNVKLLYTRITLNRFTTAFFVFGLLAFLLGVIFQSISLNDHLTAESMVSAIFKEANLNTSLGIPLIQGNTISICMDIPERPDANCTTESLPATGQMQMMSSRDLSFGTDRVSLSKRMHTAKGIFDSNGDITAVAVDGTPLQMPCVESLLWLAEMLRDAKREDIVTLCFHIWLLTLTIVTILNESLPHLATVFIGHVLLTAWAGFRIRLSASLMNTYMLNIVNGPCGGFNVLDNWWNQRFAHAIPMVVINAVALVFMTGISIKLFSPYATQSFSRVGASPRIHQLYKLVLLLSVSLQFTGFFAISSAAIWIDKIASGGIRKITEHFYFYLAAFIVVAIFTIPWLVLGWVSVRRENKRFFLVFAGVSVLMLVDSTAMFISPLYRFIFGRWPFFATLTIMSYVTMWATFAVAIFCRVRFGQGLAKYLKTKDTLDGDDFTPVVFPSDSKGDYFTPAPATGKEKKGVPQLPPLRQSIYTPVVPRPTLQIDVGKRASQHRQFRDSSHSDESFSTTESGSPGYRTDAKAPIPAPVYLRGPESKSVTSTTKHLRKPSKISKAHKPGKASVEKAEAGIEVVLPALSYKREAPEPKRSNSDASSVSSSSVKSGKSGAIGLPSNPKTSTVSRSRTLSPIEKEGKPGFF